MSSKRSYVGMAWAVIRDGKSIAVFDGRSEARQHARRHGGRVSRVALVETYKD